MSACRRLGQLRRPGRIEGWVVGFGGIAVVIQYHIGSIRLYFDLRALIGRLI
jgi:hypothetical protein